MRGISEKVTYRPGRRKAGVPLGLRSVGRAVFLEQQATQIREIDFVQIIWTLKGEGWVHIKKNTLRVKKGWLAVCLPGGPHSLATEKSTWEYRWFTIDGAFAVPLLRAFQIPESPFYVGTALAKTFDGLEKAIKDPSRNGEKIASANVYDFIARLSCREACPAEKKAGAAEKLLYDIGEELFSPAMNIKTFAHRAGLSRFSLHRLFVAELGMSPKAYLDTVRLQKVLSLLRETRLPLSQVAREAGFSNANYLAKFFRRKMKLSPREFRRTAHRP